MVKIWLESFYLWRPRPQPILALVKDCEQGRAGQLPCKSQLPSCPKEPPFPWRTQRPDLPEDEGSALWLRDPTHRIFCVCHDTLDLEMFDSLKTPSSIMSSKKKSVSPARSLPALTRTHCTWHTRPATRHGCSNTHNSSITVTSKTSSAPRLQGAPDPGGPRQAVGFNCFKDKFKRHYHPG